MKFFFKTGIFVLTAAAVLCCGCADIGAGRGDWPESGSGTERTGDKDIALKNASAVWQYADIAMGTVVQQTVYAADQETAQDFSAQSMELVRGLERERISWRLDTSEVYLANSSAGSREGFLLSEDMSKLLENCRLLWERSEGAFDVTLGAVTRLWDIDKWAAQSAQEGFEIPGEELLKQALDTCGSQRMLLIEEGADADVSSAAGCASEDGSAYGENMTAAQEPHDPLDSKPGRKGRLRLFMPEGMQLDLGAVGKGLAMEKLICLLADRPDVTGAVISLGGSILTYGSKPDGTPWRVGIVDPFDTGESIGTLTLEGQWCISTSGDYERYVEVDGVRYHHILDPETGAPAAGSVRSATILMKDGLLSDGLSTACYILGPEKGMALAAQYGAEALFVMEDGQLEMSDGMKRYFKEIK